MTRTVSTLLRLLCCMLLGAFLMPAPAAHAAKTCYDCHQALKKAFGDRTFVHDPVKKEQCESCHGRHGFAQNLVLKSASNQLCFACHQDLQAKFDSGSVHAAVKDGVCWDCHDAHASDKKGLLYAVAEGTDDPSSCLLCHGEDVGASLKAAHPHKPFNELACLTCHEAHNSQHAPLLKQDGDPLCLSCHEKDAKAMAAAHAGRHAESLHCMDCHSGHATSRPGLISARTHAPFADGDCETCHSLPDASNQVTFAAGATPSSICGGCHDEQAQAPSRSTPHPAVTSDNCADCHQPHSSRQGKLLAKAEREMCEECHSDLLADSSLVKHQPALSGQCGACHEPHGSDQAHLLRRTSSALCFECHTAMAAAKDSSASVHAALDDCLSCHSPHQGVGPQLLRKPAEQLCADCHEPDPKALTAVSAHPPYVAGDCSGCHNPHFSREKALLKASGPELCTACHTDTKDLLERDVKHPPAGEDCLTCHKAHYSDEAGLLAEAPKKLCLGCHDPVDLGMQKDHVHTAAADGDCSGCHNPHGAGRAGLITGRATRMVVAGQTVIIRPTITDQRSSLCYTCHQEMADRIQKSVAHMPVKEGLCDACHTEHGSEQPGFVKAKAPELCVGCHVVDTLAAAHQGYSVAQADCLDCHNPHVSTAAKLVRSLSHPPFAEGACDACHEKGPDGSVVPPADISQVCETCHDALAEQRNLAAQHPPFEAGECVSCHRVHAADVPRLLRAEKGQLCFECHSDLRKLDTLAAVHSPFGDQKCGDCHLPHASANAGLLNKPPQEFCLQCHTALGEALAKGQAHAPVKGGQCMACHEKHAGTQPLLLLSDKASLCGKCHDLDTPAMGTAHHGFDLSTADCQSCHEPHVGRKGSRALLLPESHKPFAQGQCSECHEGTSTNVSAGLGLCSQCHPDATTLVSKRVVHPALQQPDSCGSCHSPHVGFGAGLQKHDGVRQCLTCHNTRPFAGPVKHAPAFEDCGTCHDPHSSDNRKLLSTPDVMELCLTCHENARKTHFHPMGPGVTDPRTRKDLVCTGCHSPHSSAEPQLLLGDKNRQLCSGCHGTSDE